MPVANRTTPTGERSARTAAIGVEPASVMPMMLVSQNALNAQP